jgi:ABC-2 type transport system ATP-binding protein
MIDPIIQVNNLSKEFVLYKREPGLRGALKGLIHRTREIKRAVKSINFVVNEGEIVGYLGANGAGKSTTIKMMCGILTPSAGDCIVGGIVPWQRRVDNASQIGVVFGQRTQLWWDLPLSETFLLLKKMYKISEKAYKEKMKYFDEILDIEQFFHQTVRTLSLGQRMRADLAAALLHQPKVLFLDEPTIGLDVVVKDKIRKAIKDFNYKYKTTIILTTHDIGDIEKLCDRIIVIDDGRVVYDGSTESLTAQFANKRTVRFDIKGREATELELSKIKMMLKTNADDFNIKMEGSSVTVEYSVWQMSFDLILEAVLSNDRKSYTGAQVLRWVHEEKLTG